MKNDPVHGFSTTSGNFVQTNTDKNGNHLYQSVEAATDPLANLSEAHAAARGHAGSGTRKSNVSAVFMEVRPGTGSKN